MKTIITFLLLLTSFLIKGQTSKDTISQAQGVATKYLTLMYGDKDFDNAMKMVDEKQLLEMQDFYVKRKKEKLIDSVLSGQIKRDLSKLYTKTENFKIIEFVNVNFSNENGTTFCSLTYKFSEMVNKVDKPSGSMIVLVSKDKGKTWTILDYRIKATCDRVAKGEL